MKTMIKTYPNGLRLVVTPMANFKSVAFSMLIMAGSGDETKSEQGLSHFCEHMLFKGTTKRTGQQIIDEFAYLGVQYNAWTSECATCFHTKAVADNIDACLDLFSDMYFNLKFDPVDFDKEGDVIVQEIAMHEDHPVSVMYDRMNSLFYKGTKYEHPVAGYAKDIKAYRPDDIYRYVKKHYIAPNTILAFAGDITMARAEELVAKYYLPFMSTVPATPKQRENVPAIQPAPTLLQVKKDTEQQHVILTIPVCNQYSEDRYALTLFGLLFGGDMSSRLFISVREKLGLVYSISTNLELSDIGGSFGIVFSCTPKNTQKVIEVVNRELDLVLRDGIKEEELVKFRNQWHLQRLFDSEVTTRINNRIVDQISTRNQITPIEDELKIVDALTVADVNAVVKKYLSKDKILTVIVGK
ncbi:MAG: insulinase family protein [Eubacteriales bacterium]|nr:insulinase family protein [Eubacteriales bacterium]